MSKQKDSDSHLATRNNQTPSQEGSGFSSTQAFTLPVEAWYLVREDLTKAELKVTLCVLLNYFQVGLEAEPLTFSDILKQTKMSKSSVSSGIEAAIGRRSIFRTSHNNQTRYEPRFEKNRTHDMTCITNSPNIGHSQEEFKKCHGPNFGPRKKILDTLLKFGLAFHVAENIAMTNRYDLELLQNQIAYIEYEVANDLAPKNQSSFPGYVVNRIKYDRLKPPGFDPDPLDDNWVR